MMLYEETRNVSVHDYLNCKVFENDVGTIYSHEKIISISENLFGVLGFWGFGVLGNFMHY